MEYSFTVITRASCPSTGTWYTAPAKVGLTLSSSAKQAQPASAVAAARRSARRPFR